MIEVKPGDSQKRFVVEGTWGGYTSGQAHVCYRRVIRGNMVKRYSRVNTILFSDNTPLTLSVRQCAPREKIQELRSYDNLVADAIYSERTGFVRLVDLEADKAARREAAKAGA